MKHWTWTLRCFFGPCLICYLRKQRGTGLKSILVYHARHQLKTFFNDFHALCHLLSAILSYCQTTCSPLRYFTLGRKINDMDFADEKMTGAWLKAAKMINMLRAEEAAFSLYAPCNWNKFPQNLRWAQTPSGLKTSSSDTTLLIL